MMKTYIVLSVLLIAVVSGTAQTSRINFTAPAVYPEGTAYYAKDNVFFVSSETTGTIGKVDANGNYTVFYEEHALKSSYGMKVDIQRNKLWVCTGDANYSVYRDSATYKKLIRLISIDLTSGKKIDDINLSDLVPGQKHFANDLTLDAAGNIYVTDSYSPVIYKVNTQMQASVFCESDLFKTIDIGLNGIVWHSGEYLIVAHGSNGALYKIPVSAPSNVQKIEINSFFPGADGLLLQNATSLTLVQNKGVNKIFQITSSNNWNSAQVTAGTLLTDRFDNPTTLTSKGLQLYALNAKTNELSDPTKVPSKDFSLQLVRFISMQ